VTLINEFTVKYDSHEVIEYPKSLMSRNLLQVEVRYLKKSFAMGFQESFLKCSSEEACAT